MVCAFSRSLMVCGVVTALLVLALMSHHPIAQAQDAACAREDFESVVDEAAGALRALNRKNKPAFQERLRLLKDKRGWSYEQFIENAAPFVRDDQIGVFDRKSQKLLNEISTIGSESSTAERPDCSVLIELRARMKVLIQIQSDKWAYMFGKLSGALAQ